MTNAEVKNLRPAAAAAAPVSMKRIEKAMRRDFDNANDAADFALAHAKVHAPRRFSTKAIWRGTGYRRFDIDECLTLINPLGSATEPGVAITPRR